MQNHFSIDTVVHETFFTSLSYLFCLLPYAQVLPFIFPCCFYLIRFTAYSALLLSSKYIVYGSMGGRNCFSAMAPLFICQNVYIISAADICPIFDSRLFRHLDVHDVCCKLHKWFCLIFWFLLSNEKNDFLTCKYSHQNTLLNGLCLRRIYLFLVVFKRS